MQAKSEEQSSDCLPMLHHLIKLGDVAGVESYIQRQEAIDVSDTCENPGFSAMDLAALTGSQEIVELLVQAGLNADYSHESSPLHQAIRGNHLEVVRVLIAHGADLEYEEDDGITPLMNAIENGHLDITKFLVESGADIDATDSSGNSVMDKAQDYDDIRSYLEDKVSAIKKKLPVSEAIMLKRFFEAVKLGDVGLVANFLDNGVDPNVKDHEGYPVLLNAAFYNQPTIIDLLVNAGANIESRNDSGDTALTTSSWDGNSQSVSKLLKLGADVNASNGEGYTPLLAAVSRNACTGDEIKNRLETVEILLDYYPDPEITMEGYDALAIARMEEDPELIEMLEKYIQSWTHLKGSL